jgi:hypothetical protein
MPWFKQVKTSDKRSERLRFVVLCWPRRRKLLLQPKILTLQRWFQYPGAAMP